MKTKSDLKLDNDTLSAARAFINRIRTQYPLTHAILFGSRARGEFRPDSDADIAILLKGKMGTFLKTKLEMADIAYDILLETGIRIQPLPIWEEEWQHPEDYSNPYLLKNIEHEGVIL
ncbi:MAG: DNA polymerase III subunit beta [Thiothrix nivea]|nr:MAG: DNA polymerase III subunit beta [Thiothrix nivea]